MPQQRRYSTHAERQAAYRRRQKLAHEQGLAERGLPRLPAIATLPGQARWSAAINKAAALLLTVQEEMQTYADERSDAWQESERAMLHQERIAAVEEALDAIEGIPT